MESFGEPLSLAIAPLSLYPKLQFNYRLPLGRSTRGRILPEVSESTAATVVRTLFGVPTDSHHQKFRACRHLGDVLLPHSSVSRAIRKLSSKPAREVPPWELRLANVNVR